MFVRTVEIHPLYSKRSSTKQIALLYRIRQDKKKNKYRTENVDNKTFLRKNSLEVY
jgi:hypothetical protein